MVEIKAIIQSNRLNAVLDRLAGVSSLPGVTVSNVVGWGRTRALGVQSPVHLAGHRFAPKTKLEIVVNDEQADEVCGHILKAAATGAPGDGKIFVVPVTDVWRIRTGDRGETAV